LNRKRLSYAQALLGDQGLGTFPTLRRASIPANKEPIENVAQQICDDLSVSCSPEEKLQKVLSSLRKVTKSNLKEVAPQPNTHGDASKIANLEMTIVQLQAQIAELNSRLEFFTQNNSSTYTQETPVRRRGKDASKAAGRRPYAEAIAKLRQKKSIDDAIEYLESMDVVDQADTPSDDAMSDLYVL
jgi:hypothetical protein